MTAGPAECLLVDDAGVVAGDGLASRRSLRHAGIAFAMTLLPLREQMI
jgi:hypothetical protein